MPLSRYVFLIKADGYPSEGSTVVLPTEAFTTTVFAAPRLEAHLKACARLVDEGAQLVELCGGFSESDARAVRESVGPGVPVGHVQFDAENRARLERLVPCQVDELHKW
ncbi:MAG: DUF6506 family protein [Myxococcota bacterium]